MQGDGTDWHLGWYAALCVLFGRGLALGWRACDRCDETAVVEGPPMRRLLAVAAVYALVLPVLGLQVLLPLPCPMRRSGGLCPSLWVLTPLPPPLPPLPLPCGRRRRAAA